MGDGDFKIMLSEDGRFVSFRDSEPAFCFITDSYKEAVDMAKEAFESYWKEFET